MQLTVANSNGKEFMIVDIRLAKARAVSKSQAFKKEMDEETARRVPVELSKIGRLTHRQPK